MLIDSGASHNFISVELVCQLGLQVESTPSYNVRLCDGHKKRASGCCQKVKVKLGNYMIKETFFLFELEGLDVILRVAWLATLGVKVNWKTLIMNFCIDGQKVQISGDHKLTRTLVTPKALKKEKEIEAVSFNGKPYRYPHLLKTEIEKQVEEM